MSIGFRAPAWALCIVAVAAIFAGCGETASTSSFKGESHSVAQTISDFQSDTMAQNKKKLCANDLASTITTRLKSVGGCEAVVSEQLKQLDSFGLTIEAVTVSGTKASARVKSTWSGKSRVTTLSLVKEASRWKIAGIG